MEARTKLSQRVRVVVNPTVAVVLAAGIAGVVWSGPPAEVVDRGGVNAVLFVLVLAAALTLPSTALDELRVDRGRIVVAVLASSVVLPLLAWAAAQIVPAGPARDGVVAIGVAPMEIAVVAVAASAGARVAWAGVLLVASTIVTVVLAGPVLGVLVGDVEVDAFGLFRTLFAVVLVPLVLGGVACRWLGRTQRDLAGSTSMALVVVLVWLVASEVDVDASFARVALALGVLLVASAGLGRLLGRGAERGLATTLLLSCSMRDFAVAAAIAAGAFGDEALGPLGLYGVAVLAWGSIVGSASSR